MRPVWSAQCLRTAVGCLSPSGPSNMAHLQPSAGGRRLGWAPQGSDVDGRCGEGAAHIILRTGVALHSCLELQEPGVLTEGTGAYGYVTKPLM